EFGVGEVEARRLNAPYLKLLATGRPYVHAKWAMTLDGKIATRTGDSRWISNEASRRRVHALRGRMDAIIAGIGTALADDPLLNELGRRRMTNVLVEGGAGVLGSFLDAGEVDEVHVFLAPRLVGGAEARTAAAGQGVARIAEGLVLADWEIETVEGDAYLHGW